MTNTTNNNVITDTNENSRSFGTSEASNTLSQIKTTVKKQTRGLINDSISDMLTRIRNATLAKKSTVVIPHTKLTQQIAQILEKEGFISGFYIQRQEVANFKPSSNLNEDLVIRLKYRTKKIYKGKIKESCIMNLKRISKPGLRIYANSREIPRILGGTGIVILSTPEGLMTDIEARSRSIGGELLCSVW